MSGYIPFHVRKHKKEEEYLALVEGVPHYLVDSLWDWLIPCLYELIDDFENNYFRLKFDLVGKAQRMLRTKITLPSRDPENCPAHLSATPDFFLSLVDFSLQTCEPKNATELETILAESGSLWSVVRNGRKGFELQERVNSTVRDSYEQTKSTSGKSGLHLEQAWAANYGRNPNYTHSYAESVKAIEVAAIPIFTPKDKVPTLGKIIPHLKDAKSKYTCALNGKDNGVDHFISLCSLVWDAQDRHGTADETIPLNATKEESTMALHAAITLVHWMSNGLIKRKP
jgi:hypothetical protein